MIRLPETSFSLILNLKDASNDAAWSDFVSIYEPFIKRFGLKHGLNEADANDLSQVVLIGVSKSVKKWQPDPQRAKFRTWLFRIARNQLLNLTRKRVRELNLDTDSWNRVECSLYDKDSEQLNEQLDFQKVAVQWALAEVHNQVRKRTWQAFFLSYVEGHQISTVAENLKMTCDQVYVARSRVLHRLRREVSELQSGEEYALH